MQFSYQTLGLASIDLADASFRISTADASAVLIRSINALGVLNPPTVRAKLDRYTIVSGFARVQACQKLGIHKIDARIVSPQESMKTLAQYAVMDNAFQRELNMVEQARAVNLLLDVCTGTDELVTVAQRTGLPINQKMVKKLIAVNQMPRGLHNGLRSGAIALPIALQLNRLYGHKDMDEISRLLIALNLSLNRQRELLEWVMSITKRDKITAEQLLNEETVQKILGDPELDRRQKVTQIWQHFKLRRSPVISNFVSNYNDHLEKLKIKKGARLVAPPNFEGATYTLQIDFQNLEEMKEMEKEVHRLARSPHMTHILEQIKK